MLAHLRFWISLSRHLCKSAEQLQSSWQFAGQTSKAAQKAAFQLPHGEANGAVPGAERSGRGELLPRGRAAPAGGGPASRSGARQRAAHAPDAGAGVLLRQTRIVLVRSLQTVPSGPTSGHLQHPPVAAHPWPAGAPQAPCVPDGLFQPASKHRSSGFRCQVRRRVWRETKRRRRCDVNTRQWSPLLSIL